MQAPTDTNSSAKSHSICAYYESQQDKIKILRSNADAAALQLRKKPTIAWRELDLCKDNLFRIQPVCRVSDASIIGAFESLSKQLLDWIDNEVISVACTKGEYKDSCGRGCGSAASDRLGLSTPPTLVAPRQVDVRRHPIIDDLFSPDFACSCSCLFQFNSCDS